MDTYQRLLQVCSAVFEGEINTEDITPEANIREDININSIGLLYMAMALEEEFGIKFNNDDFINITTIGDVIEIIEKKTTV